MAPQLSNFNQKIWRTLEAQVNGWASKKGDIIVITGAIFDHDGDSAPGVDADTERSDGDARIAIASERYKIVLHERANGFVEAISIVLPHNNQSVTGDARFPFLTDHIETISEIEERTGTDFLPALTADNPMKARAIKRSRAEGLW